MANVSAVRSTAVAVVVVVAVKLPFHRNQKIKIEFMSQLFFSFIRRKIDGEFTFLNVARRWRSPAFDTHKLNLMI